MIFAGGRELLVQSAIKKGVQFDRFGRRHVDSVSEVLRGGANVAKATAWGKQIAVPWRSVFKCNSGASRS